MQKIDRCCMQMSHVLYYDEHRQHTQNALVTLHHNRDHVRIRIGFFVSSHCGFIWIIISECFFSTILSDLCFVRKPTYALCIPQIWYIQFDLRVGQIVHKLWTLISLRQSAIGQSHVRSYQFMNKYIRSQSARFRICSHWPRQSAMWVDILSVCFSADAIAMFFWLRIIYDVCVRVLLRAQLCEMKLHTWHIRRAELNELTLQIHEQTKTHRKQNTHTQQRLDETNQLKFMWVVMWCTSWNEKMFVNKWSVYILILYTHTHTYIIVRTCVFVFAAFWWFRALRVEVCIFTVRTTLECAGCVCAGSLACHTACFAKTLAPEGIAERCGGGVEFGAVRLRRWYIIPQQWHRSGIATNTSGSSSVCHFVCECVPHVHVHKLSLTRSRHRN